MNKCEPVVSVDEEVENYLTIYSEVLSKDKDFASLWKSLNPSQKQKYLLEQIVSMLSSRSGVYSFNVSVDVLDFSFLQLLQNVLRHFVGAESRVILELTEVKRLSPANYTVLKGLQDLGIPMAVDDFPTKYSIYNQHILRTLNIPFTVKVDWKHFQEVCSSAEDFQNFCFHFREYIRRIVLQFPVPGATKIVIEGVETYEFFLKAQKIKKLFAEWKVQVPVYYQGFLFPDKFNYAS